MHLKAGKIHGGLNPGQGMLLLKLQSIVLLHEELITLAWKPHQQ